MMEQENLFDSHLMSKFKIGDLVSWKHLKNEKKEYGFIEEKEEKEVKEEKDHEYILLKTIEDVPIQNDRELTICTWGIKKRKCDDA